MFAVSTGKINITPREVRHGRVRVDAPRLSTGTNSPPYAQCTIIRDDGAAPRVVIRPRVRSQVCAILGP